MKKEDGKNKKTKNLYAVVCEGKIFIATDYGYYPAEKYND